MKNINDKIGIVINRMYVGDYLSNNLGHEVINLFKADNGEHYVYLNSRGNLAKEHEGRVGVMLFVKYYAKGIVEVIGKAEGLEEADGASGSLSRKLSEENSELSNLQKEYINKQKDGVFYNGASILDIFKGAGQQSIYITYKAEAVYCTKKGKRIFVCFANVRDAIFEDGNIIVLEGCNQAKASLKQYIYPSTENDDYRKLMDLINDKSCWEDKCVQNVKDGLEILKDCIDVNRNITLFDICLIQNDENKFSNALKYFMEKYPDLWRKFFRFGKCHKYDGNNISKEEYPIDIALNRKWFVKRELDTTIRKSDDGEHIIIEPRNNSGRIDLFISDGENVVVIENKIKSGINKANNASKGKTQLDCYVKYVEHLKSNNEKLNDSYFILAPNYNIPEIEESLRNKYKVITYKNLYEFLNGSKELENDDNLKAFFDAMNRHTHENVNDYLYYDMMQKFVSRINEINNENHVVHIYVEDRIKL